MILTFISQLSYILLITFLGTFLLRLLYMFCKFSFAKIKSFLGVMIEGSEIYWKWRWRKMHKEGKLIYEKIDKHHPERGWTLTSNLKNKLHYGAYVNSNSEGIRDSREKYLGKKILFFGDSHCFGEGVNNNETISYLLEKNLKNVSCLNLGVHGYGIDQQYLYLKEVISKYKPVLTCFVMTDNDFRRDCMNFRDFAKPKFVIQDNQVVLTNTPVPKPENLFSLKKPSIITLFKELIKNSLIYYGIIEKKERIKINKFILDKIKEEIDKNHSELIFVYATDPRRGLWYKGSYINKFFINYFKKNNINYIFIEKVFGKRKFQNMFESLSGHFSPQGNKNIADKISEVIKSKEIIK